MARRITTVLLLVTIAVLVGWDIYVAANEHSGDTISEIVLAVSLKRPAIPFAVGFVCGHLFWPQSKDDGA